MSKPPFLYVGKVCLKIYRKSLGQYVDGFLQDGSEETFDIYANIQPLNYQETLMLSEQQRSNKTLKLYSRCILRSSKESSHAADEFEWEGDRYKVMKTQTYRMGRLDHTKAICERIEVTP